MKPPMSRTCLYLVIYGLLSGMISALPAVAANTLVSGKPIITFDHQHGLVPKKAQPLLSIYANGTAVAVFPAYMKKAGRYTYQLPKAELRALKALLSQTGIRQFDKQLIIDSIKENRHSESLDSGLSYISDSTVTVMNIQVDQASAESLNTAGGEILEPLSQAIVFEDVSDQARNNPGVRPLDDLQRLEVKLKAILNRAGG